MATTAPDIPLDIRELGALDAELGRASAELATADELAPWIDDLLRGIAAALRDAEPEAWESSVDPYLRVELDRIAIAALLALQADRETDRVAAVEVAIEALRDVLHDIAESAPVGDDRPGDELGLWLKEATGGSTAELAELLGVSKRTFERWLVRSSEPRGDDAMRLRLAARIVNQLRHAMTGRGVLRWFGVAMPELGGRAPRELLAEPQAAATLTGIASQARRSDAS